MLNLVLKVINILDEGPSYISDIARKLSISTSQAHKWLFWLYKNKMVTKKKEKYKRIFYDLNIKSKKLIALRKYLLSEKLEKSKAWKILNQYCPSGLFGSFAQGIYTSDSDMDVWVYLTSQTREQARQHANKLEQEFKREVNLVYMDKKYLINLKEKDPEFFYRLKLQSISEHLEVFDVP